VNPNRDFAGTQVGSGPQDTESDGLMRRITHVLAMEVKLCLVVSVSRADFKNAQSSEDEAHDAEAPARGNCSIL
jgi:hypothetical protein